MKSQTLKLAVLATAALCAAPLAKAQITGAMWENTGGAWATTPTSTLGAPNVTFTVANGPLNFTSYGGTVNPSQDYTIGTWLATGGASIVTGSSQSGNSMNNTIVLLQGLVSVTTGEQFTVQQDDGLVLNIGSDTVLNNPGPNAPTTYMGTYTGPSGNEPFTLEYSEIDGPGAVLNVDLPFTPAPVPEASTLLAGASMLLPLGVGAIRALRKNRV